MKSNKQKKREEKARQAARLQATAEYLQENKGWNWVWPGDGTAVVPGSQLPDGSGGRPLQRNCWFTGLKPKGPNSTHDGIELLGTQPYFGPSKNVIKKRKARRGLRVVEAAYDARLRVGV